MYIIGYTHITYDKNLIVCLFPQKSHYRRTLFAENKYTSHMTMTPQEDLRRHACVCIYVCVFIYRSVYTFRAVCNNVIHTVAYTSQGIYITRYYCRMLLYCYIVILLYCYIVISLYNVVTGKI